MADETTRAARTNEETPPEAGGTASQKAWYWRFLRWQWLVGLVCVPLLLHGVGLTYCFLYGQTDVSKPTQEVALGEFRFEAPPQAVGRVDAARFSLHIALLENTTAAARVRLRDREHRVQQNVEQLLREAHGTDFEDPSLAGLKRQIQERVNDTLEMRAVSDVIITGLELSHCEAPLPRLPSATVEASPREPPPQG